MMKLKKEYIIAVLAALCLVVTLLVTVPTRSQTGTEYDPWADVNDDGTIDMADVSIEIDKFMTAGTPGTKASIEYDSGWFDITDWAGKNIVVPHGLGTTDIMVDIVGRTTVDGGIHNKQIGGEDYRIGLAWNKTFGDGGWEQACSVVQTSDGGYALGGTDEAYSSAASFYLVKFDVNGNFEFGIIYEGTDEDEATSMIQTSGGGFAIAGRTYPSLGASGFDFKLMITDGSGQYPVFKTYGGTGDDYAASVVETSDGGYALAGETYSFGAGNSDFWLLKTDSSGDEEWNQTYGGLGWESATSVVQTSDDGYAIAGYTMSIAGDYRFWLVKTDSSGHEEWSQTYAPIYGDALANSLIQTSDDGYAIAGFADVYGAGTDAWLVKTDLYGTALWNKTYGYLYDEGARSLIRTSDGGYALAGWTDSLGAGYHDFWLVKTDLYGTALWSKTYGGSSSDEALSVIQTSDGGYALAGMTFSFGNYIQMWLVKTDVNGDSDRGLFRYGLAMIDSTLDTITLYRGTDDAYWNYARVRIWQPRT